MHTVGRDSKPQQHEHPKLYLPYRMGPHSPQPRAWSGRQGFMCHVMGPGVGIKGSLGPVGAGVGGGKPGVWRPGSHGRGAGRGEWA